MENFVEEVLRHPEEDLLELLNSGLEVKRAPMLEDFLAKGVSSLIVIAIAIGLFLFLLYMLADCLRRPFKKPAHKILWFFFIVFFQTIGAFIYWLLVYRRN